MKRPLACLLVFFVGCASNKKFVADQTAARMYHEDRYERACVEVKGPPTCKRMQEVLNLLEHHEPKGCDPAKGAVLCKPVGLIPLANAVQQVGEMPKMERQELKKLMQEVERLP